MQRYFLTKSILLIFMLCSIAFCAKLMVSGNKIMHDSREVILKGVNLSGYEYYSAPWINTAALTEIGSVWQANVIRLPINKSFYMTDTFYVKSIKTKVKNSASYGMWVILDYHWTSENTKQEDCASESDLKVFWNKVAKDYVGVDNVLYDIYNEPHSITWSAWKTRAENVIASVLTIDPSAVFIVGGIDWGYNLNDAVSNPVNTKYKNIIYSSHHYPWKDGATGGAYQGLIGKYPLLIGEFGYWNGEGSMQGNLGDLAWVNSLLSYLNSKQISYTAWNFDSAGSPVLLSSRKKFTRNSLGNTIYSDIKSKSLVRFDPVAVKAGALKKQTGYSICREGRFIRANVPVNRSSEWDLALLSISGQLIKKVTVKENGFVRLKLLGQIAKGTYIVQIQSKNVVHEFSDFLILN